MADHVFWWFIIKYVSDTEKGSTLASMGTGNTGVELQFCQKIVVCH